MARRTVTPAYVIFYILFLPDSWRILIGLAAAAMLDHFFTGSAADAVGRTIIFLMAAAIGYAASAVPGRLIAGMMKKMILGAGRDSFKRDRW
ncbi:MAG: hypothetical protein ACLFQ9_03075 [Desulfobacterales bacterium]